MKTLVRAKRSKFGVEHPSGKITATWLNSLGPDKEKHSPKTTNGKVRRNWLKHHEQTHIELVD